MDFELEFKILERKRGVVLLFEGHRYYKQKVYANKSIIWFCSNRRKQKCIGSVTVNDGKILKRVEHSSECKPDYACNEILCYVDKMKNEAGTSPESVPSIFNNHIKPIYNKGLHLITKVPSFDNVKRSLYSARKKMYQVKKTVFTQLDEVEIPAQFHKFLVADYQYAGSRVILFCSPESKKQLSPIKEYFIDGTFKSTPKPFTQLFSIHGDLKSTSESSIVVPLVYALMSDKKETTYLALFDILTTLCPEWAPIKVHADFEFAATNAIKFFFPNISIKKCYYHFSNSIWRKSNSIGIKSKLYQRIVAMCASLPLLPIASVRDGWRYIQSQSEEFNDAKLNEFLKYMKNTWIKDDDFINEWCVYNERHRTNNVLENWHSQLNKRVNKNYVTIVKLLSVLQEDATTNLIKIISIEHKTNPNKRRKLELDKDFFLIMKQMELIHGEITAGQFLETVR